MGGMEERCSICGGVVADLGRAYGGDWLCESCWLAVAAAETGGAGAGLGLLTSGAPEAGMAPAGLGGTALDDWDDPFGPPEEDEGPPEEDEDLPDGEDEGSLEWSR